MSCSLTLDQRAAGCTRRYFLVALTHTLPLPPALSTARYLPRNPSTPSFTLSADDSSSYSVSSNSAIPPDSSSASIKSAASAGSNNTTTGAASSLAVANNRMADLTLTAPPSPTPSKSGSFLSRWTRSAAPSPSASKTEFLAAEPAIDVVAHPEGPVEELVVSGAAFGLTNKHLYGV